MSVIYWYRLDVINANGSVLTLWWELFSWLVSMEILWFKERVKEINKDNKDNKDVPGYEELFWIWILIEAILRETPDLKWIIDSWEDYRLTTTPITIH
jgi:hypothetical protein